MWRTANIYQRTWLALVAFAAAMTITATAVSALVSAPPDQTGDRRVSDQTGGRVGPGQGPSTAPRSPSRPTADMGWAVCETVFYAAGEKAGEAVGQRPGPDTDEKLMSHYFRGDLNASRSLSIKVDQLPARMVATVGKIEATCQVTKPATTPKYDAWLSLRAFNQAGQACPQSFESLPAQVSWRTAGSVSTGTALWSMTMTRELAGCARSLGGLLRRS